MVNLALLVYQYIVGVGSVNNTTYLRTISFSQTEAIFMLEGFQYCNLWKVQFQLIGIF